MTTPVTGTNKDDSESIKMTVPVMDTSVSPGRHLVAFTMPSKYTLESLPKPNNANIRLRIVEPSRRAVMTYTFYATNGRVESKKNILLSRLTRDSLQKK